jgi:hypothetical protein
MHVRERTSRVDASDAPARAVAADDPPAAIGMGDEDCAFGRHRVGVEQRARDERWQDGDGAEATRLVEAARADRSKRRVAVDLGANDPHVAPHALEIPQPGYREQLDGFRG